MLRKTVVAVVVAAVAGIAGVEYASAPASAAVPYAPLPSQLVTGDSNVQNVAWVYVKGKHGNRYMYKRPGYGFYYGGWWYAKPWWKVGPTWVYVPTKHGYRYKYARPGYGYKYGGWYYKRPWWKY
ncbi:MAG: hypothetical protein JNJ53_07965 [Rhizobiales bacterium]|nr:hypothetical protein [Hyphomicrobiales bacterium]